MKIEDKELRINNILRLGEITAELVADCHLYERSEDDFVYVRLIDVQEKMLLFFRTLNFLDQQNMEVTQRKKK